MLYNPEGFLEKLFDVAIVQIFIMVLFYLFLSIFVSYCCFASRFIL